MSCHQCGILSLRMDGEFINSGRAPNPSEPPTPHLYINKFSPSIPICHRSLHVFNANLQYTSNYILTEPKWELYINRRRNGVQIDGGPLDLPNSNLNELIYDFSDPRLNYIPGDKVTLTLHFTYKTTPIEGREILQPPCIYIRFDQPIEYQYCPICISTCREQTANIPGNLSVTALITKAGEIYEVPKPYNEVTCRKVGKYGSNFEAAARIKALIDSKVSCNPVGLRVLFEDIYMGKYCLILKLLNSPVQFASVMMSDGRRYDFDTSKC